MKTVPLSITESYVAHWSWWQGVRELIQNAVDTNEFEIVFKDTYILIKSSGGKIPVSALLLGKTSKADDDSTIGKFGEGMKLGFLVLKRLGANVQVFNGRDLWVPDFQFNEIFGEKSLTVNIHEGYLEQGSEDDVSIVVDGIPVEEMKKIKENFAPSQEKVVVAESQWGKAYEKPSDRTACRLYVNGIFVTEIRGKFKFDYDFLPSAFVLDRDRDSASSYEVKYEATKLLSASGDILLLAELATSDYDDIENYNKNTRRAYYGYSSASEEEDEVTLCDEATRLFELKYGEDAFPISASWNSTKKRLVTTLAIKKGFTPVEVKHALFEMLENNFDIEAEVTYMMDFDALKYLQSFRDKFKRKMYSKAYKELGKTIDLLKIAKGEE